MFGGRELVNRVGGSVVGILDHDGAGVLRMRFCETPREVVRFASRAYEHAGRKITGQGCGEAVRIFKDGFVEVTRVGVQHGRLLREGLDHAGMTMSDLGNIISICLPLTLG